MKNTIKGKLNTKITNANKIAKKEKVNKKKRN